MILEETATFYELLEVTSAATQQEIRSAYLRAKSAYRKDSVALYTLISSEETEGLLQRIEEAYQVLSNPEKRREYDRNHGIPFSDDSRGSTSPFRMGGNVVSIDRVPPMDLESTENDPLVAPTTDISAPPHHQQSVPRAPAFRTTTFPTESPAFLSSSPVPTTGTRDPFRPFVNSPPQPFPALDPNAGTGSAAPSGSVVLRELSQEIAQETEWRGSFLRKIRDARRVSIEELAESTKISRTYLNAIEDENYAKLPAPVYLRGFLTQVAKFLRLPADKVASAYLARYHQARGESK